MRPKAFVSVLAFLVLSALALPVARADNSGGGGVPESDAAPNFQVVNKPSSGYRNGTCLISLAGIADGTQLNAVSGCGVTISFSSTVEKLAVPAAGWSTWSSPPHSETATPHVLYTVGQTSLTLRSDKPLRTLGVEIEPNPFALRGMSGAWRDAGGGLLGALTRPVHGHEGARLLAGKVSGGKFSSLTVSSDANDFAIAQIRVR